MQQYKGRAFYNVLSFADQLQQVQPWQVASYRALDEAVLWHGLKELSILIEMDGFKAFANHCDSPEELTDCLIDDNDSSSQTYDKVYLHIFELWRRHIVDKRPLSIFADDLDHTIAVYEEGRLEGRDGLIQALQGLEDILDGMVDDGVDPQEAFDVIAPYFAHDIETFLYDFIIDIMDTGMVTEASELIDGFHDYVREGVWFDFLKARLFSVMEAEEADMLMMGIIEQLGDDFDLELCFEIASFVVTRGDPQLFLQCATLLANAITAAEDYKMLLTLIVEFYRCLDNDTREKAALQELNTFKENTEVGEEERAFILEMLKYP